jgi:hypothetical protein
VDFHSARTVWNQAVDRAPKQATEKLVADAEGSPQALKRGCC